MLRSLYRGLVHLRRGTVLERIRSEWREYTSRKRTGWWQSQKGIREQTEVSIQPGVRMRLYFDSRLSQLIYCDDFERQQREFLNAFLRQGEVFVDIGANIGLFTLIAAYRVGSTGRVYAFEPCSTAHRRLLANVQLNRLDNVSCHQSALSDLVGQLNMTVSLDGFDAWNSFAQPIAGHSFAVETVNCTTWDNFVQGHNLAGRVTMMKIDVEGWEGRVLSGAYEALAGTDGPVLQVEFADQAAQSAGSSCARLYDSLRGLGHQMFTYDAKSRELVHDPLRESYSYLNLIAVKQPERIVARLKKRSILC